MQITAPQIPTPSRHIHTAARVARVLTQTVIDFLVVFGHSELVKRARLLAEPRICFVVEVLIARYDYIFRLVFVPFRFDTLQFAVGIEQPFGNGKIYRVQLVLIARALARCLCAVIGMPHVELDRFQFFHRTQQIVFGVLVCSVALCVAREFVSTAHAVIARVVRARFPKLYARNVVTPIAVVALVRAGIA